MASFRERTRFATVLAVGAVLVASGVVAGAAGGYFILGQANSAGTSNTSLTTSSSGNALLVTQNGSGTALRGSTGSGAGIAGFFTSGSGSGVSGVVANANSYAVYAANDSASTGTGAALRVAGKQNRGVVATSSSATAITGTASGSAGWGSNGVQGQGYGLAAGVLGDGTDSIAGVYGYDGAAAGVYAYQSNPGVNALLASTSSGTAVRGQGSGTAEIADCDTYYCAGAEFTGPNGVLAATDTGGGYALYGADQTGTDSAWALIAAGDTSLNGDVYISGTCTGCTVSAAAVNGGDATLKQGDAVTLLGVDTASDGSTLLVVGAAKKGDAVLGIVDRELTLSPKSVQTKASERKVLSPGKGEVTVKVPAGELKAQSRKWLEGGTSVPAGGKLRLVTSGVYTMDAAIADASTGDTLAVGEKAGKLGKASADVKGLAGKYLGKLKDGRTVLLVDPS